MRKKVVTLEKIFGGKVPFDLDAIRVEVEKLADRAYPDLWTAGCPVCGAANSDCECTLASDRQVLRHADLPDTYEVVGEYTIYTMRCEVCGASWLEEKCNWNEEAPEEAGAWYGPYDVIP